MQTGFTEYLSRFPKDIPFELLEIPTGKRGKNTDIKLILEKESVMMLAAAGKDNRIVTLDIPGSTVGYPRILPHSASAVWQDGRDVSLLLGGSEGLAPACKAAAQQSWALSILTIPPPLFRELAAASLYRAWNITINHPTIVD